MREYPLRDFSRLRGLRGIPDSLVEAHLKLYAGYVKNLNALSRRLAELRPGLPEWSELHRRVGFELDGMRLHELYFENLSPGPSGASRAVLEAIARSWPSFEAWREEFAGLGALRGVGWVILYRDPQGGGLSNHWIGLHEVGHPAGFEPILVMDVWEHAYTGIERPRYVESFLENADWSRVEGRLSPRPEGRS